MRAPTVTRPAEVPATRRVHDARRYPRLARELKTIRAMVHIYCRDRHRGAHRLCQDCEALFAYATRRLDRCVFGDAKPTCAKCVVHCYNADMREQVRAVMRYSGPRMLLIHPLLAMAHVRDGRRRAPPLPARSR